MNKMKSPGYGIEGVGERRVGAHPGLWLVALLIFAVLIFASESVAGEGVAIIVHKDSKVDTLSVEDLRRYYSDILVTWPDGEKVKIFDLPMDDSTRQVFSAKVLGKAPQDVTMDWASKRITNMAKNPPTILKSQLLMLSKVGQSPNTLGYISEERVDKQKVKVVLVIK